MKQYIELIQTDWKQVIETESCKKYFQDLVSFINQQYQTKTIYPKIEDVFACFNYFNTYETKLVILGQDPYHTPNVADGLAFSTKSNVKPKSLVNIYKELKSDLNVERTSYDLQDIAKQGVLLLNTCLTVEKGKPYSHNNKGWEIFTDNIISYLDNNYSDVIYLLMGNHAANKKQLLKHSKYVFITSHPSPFSFHISFSGSKVFSKINEVLHSLNKKEILW